MKLDAEKLHTVIHDIVNLGFVVHDIETQLTKETSRINKLKEKLKKLEKNLIDLRQGILLSIEEDEE